MEILSGLWLQENGELRSGIIKRDKLQFLLDMIAEGEIKFKVLPNTNRFADNHPRFFLAVGPAANRQPDHTPDNPHRVDWFGEGE